MSDMNILKISNFPSYDVLYFEKSMFYLIKKARKLTVFNNVCRNCGEKYKKII